MGPCRFQGFSSVEYVEYWAGFTCRGFTHVTVANAGIFIQPRHRLATVCGLARCHDVGTAEPVYAGKPVSAKPTCDKRTCADRHWVQPDLKRAESCKLKSTR